MKYLWGVAVGMRLKKIQNKSHIATAVHSPNMCFRVCFFAFTIFKTWVSLESLLHLCRFILIIGERKVSDCHRRWWRVLQSDTTSKLAYYSRCCRRAMMRALRCLTVTAHVSHIDTRQLAWSSGSCTTSLKSSHCCYTNTRSFVF